MKKPCTVAATHGDLTIERCESSIGGPTLYRAKRNGRSIGVAEAYQDGQNYVVGAIELDESEVQKKRTGTGTRLYEQVTRDACSMGLRLSSDTLRSHFAEAFWRKQQTKGRAVCTPGDGEVYVGPVAALKRKARDGTISKEQYEALTEKLPRPDGAAPGKPGTWPCARYTVPRPCAHETLAGVRKRKR